LGYWYIITNTSFLYTKIRSKNLKGVGVMSAYIHPHLKILSTKLIEKCNDIGIEVQVTDTLRTLREQSERYKFGRIIEGEILTYNKPRDSFHNYGLAFDVECFVKKDSIFINKSKSDIYRFVGSIGKSLGLLWGGDSEKLCDYNHFTLNFGLSLEELKLGDNGDIMTKRYKYSRCCVDYDATVKARPNITSKTVGVIESGNIVRVIRYNDKWVEIDFLGARYYILLKCFNRLP
jgi:hypothetical protein